MTTQNNNDLFKTFVDVMKQMQRYGFATRGGERGRHHGFGRGRLLQLIADNENVTQSELSELLDVRPSSLSEMLSKLADRDLIERKPDENDKRISHVVLTDKGKDVLKERQDDVNTYMDDLFDGLTEEESTNLTALLTKLNGSLKDKLADVDDAPEGDFGPFAGGHGHGRFNHHDFEGREGFGSHGFDHRHHDEDGQFKGMMNGFWN